MTMRSVILIVLAVLAFPSTVRAQARDNYPVCLRVYTNIVDWYDECGYTSIPQCQASASGRSAQCLANPFFVAAPEKSRRHRRHRGD
jgi:hypothetical protein